MAAGNGQLIDLKAEEYSANQFGATRLTKIEKHGWTIRNSPGEFEMVNKARLDIDPIYQRVQSEHKVNAIASAWNWLACGVLSVALRGERLFVFDGGHRLLAARKRADIRELPCMVYATDGVHEEAEGFLDANTLRKPVTAIEKFNAMVIRGLPTAIRVRDMIEASGYRITPFAQSGKTVKCVALLMKHVDGCPDILDGIWPVVIGAAHGNPIRERVVDALVFAEARMPEGKSLALSPYRKRLVSLGMDGLNEAAGRAAAFYSRGGAGVWAAGIIEALNKGTRTNRLKLVKDSIESPVEVE